VNAFTTALADEVAQAWATLLRARERQDDAAVTDAVERLRDLDEIGARVRDGLELAGH
jgi:hypothetical protein